MRHGGRMRITCPSCAADYEVPDTLLAGGRALRCQRCGTQFTAGAAEPPAVAPPPAPPVEDARPPAPPPAPAPPAPDSEPPAAGVERRASRVGWIISLIVLAAAAVLAVAYRAEIIAAWPPAERLFRALGLS